MKTKLSENSISQLNIEGSIGREIHFFESLTSTFDKIREYEPTEGLTVVCTNQTNGSGRLGRKWNSPEGGIYLTFSLTPPYRGFEIPFITNICALGVCNAISKYTPCSIKWPNDIVSNGKKLCGILTRNTVSDGIVASVLVGIGINVNIDMFPRELCHAESVKRITGKTLDENIFLKEVLCEINKAYTQMSAEEILNLYTKNCVNIGRSVIVHYAADGKDIEGICTEIMPDGSMNVMTGEGIINVHSGEVSVNGIYE